MRTETCRINLKRVWRLWLEINDKDLLKGLRVCTQETNIRRQKPRSVPMKKEKLRILIPKSTFLRIIRPPLLVLGLAEDSYQLDVRQSE